MLTLAQIRKGLVIVYQNEPYLVVSAQHSKTAQARAVVRGRIKHLRNNNLIEVTFNGSDKIEAADLTYKKCQYLYNDENSAYFMDEAYEQFGLSRDIAGEQLPFLREGQQVDIAFWEGHPVYISLPPKVDLKVVEAAPAVKGDTATNAYKTVKLETGLEVLTPMFVKEGEMLRINTETGEYVERAWSFPQITNTIQIYEL